MKKIFIAAAFIVLGAATVNAKTNNNVDEKVTAAFKADFAGAENITWSKEDDFYYARFTLENKNVTAIYSADNAGYVGYFRTINAESLPLSIRLYLNKNYQGYKFTGTITEIGSPDTEAYIVTVENEKQLLKLKVDTKGNSTKIQRIKKI
jgi:hypothetical protein